MKDASPEKLVKFLEGQEEEVGSCEWNPGTAQRLRWLKFLKDSVKHLSFLARLLLGYLTSLSTGGFKIIALGYHLSHTCVHMHVICGGQKTTYRSSWVSFLMGAG